MVTPLTIDEIVSDPQVRGGSPVIVGTGIRVVDLVAYHLGPDHMTAQEIAVAFELSMGQVHAALAYYYLHQAELDQAMQRDSQEAENLRQRFDSEGSLLP